MSIAHWTRVAWWGFPAACAIVLAAPSVRLPGDDLGLRRFHTPPLGPDLRLGQIFTMTGDGLRAIEVLPVAGAARVSGDVRFELHEIRDGQMIPVRIAEVLAEDLLRTSSYRFEFAPISNSKDRVYRLDLVAAPAQVAFWATKGERYEGGSMHANGRARWADLSFRVHAPAPSIWRRLMTLRTTNPVRAYLAITSFTAIWLLLGVVLRTLPNLPPEPDHTGPSRAA